MIAVSPFAEVTEAIIESGGEALKKCYQCGTCSGSCPWGTVKRFSIRELIRLTQYGLEGYEAEGLWDCVTCGLCVKLCPRGVEIIDIIKAVRGIVLQTGLIPQTMRSIRGSLNSNENPWMSKKEDRLGWTKNTEVPVFTAQKQYLYFPCCTLCYDSRNQKVARSLAAVFNAARLSYGILGIAEKCCGESIRKVGDEDLFQTLAQGNIDTFKEKGVKEVIVSSPHCLYTITQEYPALDGKFSAFHYTQILESLIKAGSIKFEKELKKKVTFHDPCYLGRHCGIYDSPRTVIKSIPGVELVEMDRIRDDSFCCGGGGGGMWLERPKDQRISNVRLEEAIDTGAQILLTACPYCTLMFEDSVTSQNKKEVIEVMDIAEFVNSALI